MNTAAPDLVDRTRSWKRGSAAPDYLTARGVEIIAGCGWPAAATEHGCAPTDW